MTAVRPPSTPPSTAPSATAGLGSPPVAGSGEGVAGKYCGADSAAYVEISDADIFKPMFLAVSTMSSSSCLAGPREGSLRKAVVACSAEIMFWSSGGSAGVPTPPPRPPLVEFEPAPPPLESPPELGGGTLTVTTVSNVTPVASRRATTGATAAPAPTAPPSSLARRRRASSSGQPSSFGSATNTPAKSVTERIHRAFGDMATPRARLATRNTWRREHSTGVDLATSSGTLASTMDTVSVAT